MNLKKLKYNFIKRLKAFTLVELVMSIVIMSIAFVGTILAFYTVSKRSAKPILISHSLAIAKSYLTEILLKDFPTTLPCPSPPASGRKYYNNICDYQNLHDIGAYDQEGQPIAGLENYEVRVNIDTTTAQLGELTAGTEVVRIDVTTWLQDSESEVIISGYKTNY